MENQQDIRAMWDTAVAAYEKETERKLVTSVALREVTTVDGLVDLIEHQNSDFSGFRSRHAKLASRLQKCFKPVAIIGGIAKETLSTTPYGPASSAIFGAVVHLIQTAQKVTEAYDWIEQALGQLQEFTDRLSLYRQNTMDAVLEKKITAILTCLLKLIGRCETLVTRGRFKQYLHVVFLVKDEKTKKMLDDLNESLDKEQRYVVAASYASQKTTEQVVKALAETTAETQKVNESTVRLLEGTPVMIECRVVHTDEVKIPEHEKSPMTNSFLSNVALSCQQLRGPSSFMRSLDSNCSKVRAVGFRRRHSSQLGRSRRSRFSGCLEVQDQESHISPHGQSIIYFGSMRTSAPKWPGCLLLTSTSKRMNSSSEIQMLF